MRAAKHDTIHRMALVRFKQICKKRFEFCALQHALLHILHQPRTRQPENLGIRLKPLHQGMKLLLAQGHRRCHDKNARVTARVHRRL